MVFQLNSAPVSITKRQISPKALGLLPWVRPWTLLSVGGRYCACPGQEPHPLTGIQGECHDLPYRKEGKEPSKGEKTGTAPSSSCCPRQDGRHRPSAFFPVPSGVRHSSSGQTQEALLLPRLISLRRQDANIDTVWALLQNSASFHYIQSFFLCIPVSSTHTSDFEKGP